MLSLVLTMGALVDVAAPCVVGPTVVFNSMSLSERGDKLLNCISFHIPSQALSDQSIFF